MAEQARKVRALCHICMGYHPATELAGEAFEAAKEDAQCLADYFQMDEHINPKTGQKCEGAGKAPENLVEDDDDGDDGNYLEPGDIDYDGYE
jgi:hypothetical protein